MERFNALGRGAQMMLVGGVLLFIDLFLSWQKLEIEGVDVASRRGWYGFAGIVLGLLTIVMLAWLIVRLASVNIPLPVSTAMTGALLGSLILIFAVIKLLTILGDEATIWAWIGLGLAVVIAVGSFQVVQESGGVEQLKSEIPSMPAGSQQAPSATQAPPPPPPAAPPSQETAPPPPAQAPPAQAPPAQAPPTSEPERPSEASGEEERPA